MKKILFLVQARSGSTRFQNKVFENIYKNFNLLDLVVNRVTQSKFVNKKNMFVLIPNNENDNFLSEYLQSKKINCFRGDEFNVYKRFYDFLINNECDYFFRICCDNPFIMPEFIDNMILKCRKKNHKYDYISYCNKFGKPAILSHYGFFCEMIKYETFINSKKFVISNSDKEHVSSFFYNKNNFNNLFLKIPNKLDSYNIRLTFDTIEDLNVIRVLYLKLDKIDFSYTEVIDLLLQNNYLLKDMELNINKNIKE